jgi:hypothetical protein
MRKIIHTIYAGQSTDIEGHFQGPRRRSPVDKKKKIEEIEQESKIKSPIDKPEVA